MKTVITALAASISCLISASSFAQEAPAGGLPELAEQVEQNANAISAITIGTSGPLIYANGAPIGLVATHIRNGGKEEVECPGAYGPLPPSDGDPLVCRRVIFGQSSTGYIFAMDSIDAGPVDGAGPWFAGQLDDESVYFDGPNCLGQRYVTGLDFGVGALGIVFASRDPADPIQTYYLPPLAFNTYRDIYSYRASSGCYDFGGTPEVYPVFRVFQNDPLITGVPDGGFTPPITIGP